MTNAVADQLRQQNIHVVLHSTQSRPNDSSNGVSMVPTDSEVMIRLQVSDQPAPQTTDWQTNEPDIDEVAWQVKVLFERQSQQGLELAEAMHSQILTRAGLADGGIQSTDTLWPDVSPDNNQSTQSLNTITPDASVLVRLSPITALEEDYPPIPITPLVWAIATTTVNALKIESP